MQSGPVKPMTVRQFIEYLQTVDQDLLVAHQMMSENCLLEADDIKVTELCVYRPDGWVANNRDGKEHQLYLLLPGN